MVADKGKCAAKHRNALQIQKCTGDAETLQKQMSVDVGETEKQIDRIKLREMWSSKSTIEVHGNCYL